MNKEVAKSIWENAKNYNSEHSLTLEERRAKFMAETSTIVSEKHNLPIHDIRPEVEKWKGLVVELPKGSNYISPTAKGKAMQVFESNWREENYSKTTTSPEYVRDYIEWSNAYLKNI
ncbi:hypothetical protein [Flagellimonas allohymeniacidonis]|uniref:Uncharacterized protein n=1 Tax=Flagellimonas allohymeniacidonis TaxID=2517819 RepID=A0A4Q8QJR1_9FLAO|nr:hypothetical protein [Allomuricauda hymeniacidonis]TAI48993.1 hypothetical protein EW142_04140 [Allomuricauda hymeniacidonis]